MLTFDVTGQTLIRTDNFTPATDSVNYLMTQFNFKTNEWRTGKTKTALFRLGDTSYPAILDDEGKCIVPWEALVHGDGQCARKNGSVIHVSLLGEAGTTRITTDEISVKLKSSGYGDREDPETPTAGEYQQILTICGEMQTKMETTMKAAGNAVKGVKTGAVVALEDMSPLAHNITLKVSGVGDPTTAKIRLYGKNLLDVDCSSETVNGVTFTINADGSVKVVGTSTGVITQFLAVNFPNMVKGERYILSGCPTDGTDPTFYLRFIDSGSDGLLDIRDRGDGVEFEFMGYARQHNVAIIIREGVTMNHTFYPMIRHASVKDDTFETYCPLAIGTPDRNGNSTIYTSNLSGVTCPTILTWVEGAMLKVEYHRDINDALGSGAFIVNMTVDNGVIKVIDKTYAETLAAFMAGRQLECRVNAGYDGWCVLSPVRVYGADGIIFGGHSGNTGAVWTTVTFLDNNTATFNIN